jgi:hypothetical protein
MHSPTTQKKSLPRAKKFTSKKNIPEKKYLSQNLFDKDGG